VKLALRKHLRAFGRGEDGIAAVEFALLFPFIFFLFIWAVELGILMTKSVMLEHALDVAMRDLRLGRMVNPTSDTLKDAICTRARIVDNCRGTIMLDLQPVNTATWTLPERSVACQDRDQPIQPVVSFTIGQQNQIMLVRACVIVNPLFPGTGIGAMLRKDADGGFGMVAMSAFVNEPS
jgi:Flp pilus assembly pilin Flp